MDWQSAFNLLFMAFMTVCGWVLKSVHEAVHTLTQDLKALEKEVPEKYARKDDLRLMLADIKSDQNDIKSALIRIEEKLDGKVDK
jgi:septal ring factor EnvC (AmiA/AmiB activator)